MPSITFRLDQELYDKIELQRGDTDRSKYLKDIIVLHFDLQGKTNEEQNNTDERQSKTNVLHLENEIEYLRSENTKLLELLNQAQILQLQAQKKLLPESKAWWQFWKK